MMNSAWFSLLIHSINSVLDQIAPTVFEVGLVFVTLIYTFNRMKNEGFVKGFYLGSGVLIEATVLFLFLHVFPTQLYGIGTQLDERTGNWMGESFRWLFIWLIVRLYWGYVSRKNDDTREQGVRFATLILTTYTLGWLLGRWVGMLFLSTPILLLYLHVIHKMAQVIIPASGTENLNEMLRKTWFLLTYLAGIQYPIWAAKASATRDLETRIPGDQNNDFGKVGIVWTHAHQVAGISINIAFNRVEGPGLIYTNQYELPVTLVDLRRQNRLTEIDAVTRDGMKIKVKAVTVFMIDNRPGEPSEYASLPHIGNRNYMIDHLSESFAYSSGRARLALGMTSVTQSLENADKKTEAHWDNWVSKQTEQVVRQVIAERALDELWHPQHNDRGISALDEMANHLKARLEPILINGGVQLFAARVVNFMIEDDDPIIEENMKAWSSYWEQRVAHADAEIEVIYRDEIEKAHAYSKSLLLNAIAESLAKASQINEKLPRHVIAQYFIHALDEYIKGQPGVNIEESKKRIAGIREILNFHMEGNE